MHTAFRDARALTCLPRSLDLPLPDFVRQRDMAARRDSLRSQSVLTIPTNPSAGPLTSKSCIQLPLSQAGSPDSCIMEEIRSQPEFRGQGSRNPYGASLTRSSLPTNGPSSSAVLSPYFHSTIPSRSSLPSSMPSPLTHASSPKRLRSSYNSPPPTTPLPDIPSDPLDDDTHILPLHLLPPDRPRHISWDSRSSSSSLSSYPSSSPRTPGNGQPPYPAFSSNYAAIIRGDDYPPHREASSSSQPSVVEEYDLSETDIPSMLLSNRPSSSHMSLSSECDFPVAYRDSPILSERPVSRTFGDSLDNTLKLCRASLVVRREVARCLRQDPGYERHTWLTVLRECDITEENILSLLNEMTREAGFASTE